MRLALGLLCSFTLAGHACAFTQVRIESGVGDPIGGGVVGTFTPPVIVGVAGHRASGGPAPDYADLRIDGSPTGSEFRSRWSIVIEARDGETLHPGTFDAAYEQGVYTETGRMHVTVTRDRADLSSCPRALGTLAIRAIDVLTFDGNTILKSLVADFTLRCDGYSDGIQATIDLAAGDPGCFSALESTPCDDSNPCTTDDHCVGTSCEPGTPLVCSDGIAATDDACVAHEGCTFRVATTTWATHGLATVTAVAASGSTSRTLRTMGLLLLRADGTFSIPGSTPPCAAVPSPIELQGTWSVERQGHFSLDTINAQDVADALRDCEQGVSRARVLGARHTIRVGARCRPTIDAASERRLCGRDRLRMAVVILGQRIRVTIAERYSARRTDDGEYVLPARP